MRVITGKARGRKLVTVSGSDLVRPTSEKVKEAVFSSIQFDIEGRKVIDLFAGCGQMGIEALSRGAESAVFVDASETSLSAVRQNLKATGFEDISSVFKSDYRSFLVKSTDRFDIAFLDPPYNAGVLEDALKCVVPRMSDYGIIICEHPKEINLPESEGVFSVYRKYGFGKIAVTVYKKGVAADE